VQIVASVATYGLSSFFCVKSLETEHATPIVTASPTHHATATHTHTHMIADTPQLVDAYRLLTIKGALKLETLGMMHSRGSVAPTVREMLGSKTKNKSALLAELTQYLRDQGILQS
jgi:hypothetical protein